MHAAKRPTTLLTLAQGCCIIAARVVGFFFFTPAYVFFTYLDQARSLAAEAVSELSGLLCLRDALTGLCLVCAALEAIGVCGRVKKSSAFSEKNEKALGRIAAALGIAGGVSLLFGDAIIPWLLTGLPAISPIVERLLLPFMLLTLAAMVRTVQVLMRRAQRMQTENDLTV